MRIFKKKSLPAENAGSSVENETVYEEDLVHMVQTEAEKRREQRRAFDLQWQLNTNFLLGNQHCDINVHRMSVENYQPLYDYMSREVFNRIAPIMETRLSHLQTVSYNMTVLPKTGEYEDFKKARIATALLWEKQQNEEYKSAFSRALGLCEQTGNAFFLSWWGDGDLNYTVLTPYEVLPGDLYEESVEGQESVIIEQIKDVKEIEMLYGVTVKGKTNDSYGVAQKAGAGGLGYESATLGVTFCKRENTVLLRTYMEKPTVSYPDGRLIITAGETLLFCGNLPYDSYPLCHFKSEKVTGQFFGKSVIETLIPYQRSYNGIKNRINDFINRSTCGQLLIEEGSVDADDLTEKGLVPGEPVLYQRGSALPKLLEEPQLSDLALAQCDQLAKDMEYAAGVSGLMTGGVLPSGVTSGSAIGMLRSIDTTRLSVYADNIRTSVLRLARLWLEIYRRYLVGERALVLTGKNEKGAVMYFTSETFNSEELTFESENELKVRAEKQRADYIEALQLGIFSEEDGKLSKRAKERAARRLLGKQDLAYTEGELQMQNACAENAAFEDGAKLSIKPFDDHGLHLEEHRLYALQQRFRNLLDRNPERCKEMLSHIEAHEKALEAEKKKGESENGNRNTN